MRSGRGCSVGGRIIGGPSHGARRTIRSGSWSQRSSCSVRAARPSRRSTSASSSGGRPRRPISSARRSIGSVIRPLGLVRRAATLKALASEVAERGERAGFDGRAYGTSRVSAGTRRAPRLPSRSRSVLRSSMASAPVSIGGTSGLEGRRSCRVRYSALGARVGGHPSPTGPGVELVGTGSRGVCMSPEDSALRGVSAPSALCLVAGGRLIESEGRASINGSDHNGVISPRRELPEGRCLEAKQGIGSYTGNRGTGRRALRGGRRIPPGP